MLTERSGRNVRRIHRSSFVFMPHGGKYQKTEKQAMVAKLPVLTGDCDTVEMMSYGFDPYLSTWSPYHGAIYAVTESIAKIVAAGGDYSKIRFTFQGIFPSYDRRSTQMESACSNFAVTQCTAWIRTSIHRWKGQYVRSIPTHLCTTDTGIFRSGHCKKRKTLSHRNLRKPEINWYGFGSRQIITTFLYTRKLWISTVNLQKISTAVRS